MDMALEVIARRHGMALAVEVSEQLIHDRLRSRGDHQRMTLARRLGSHNPRLVEAVAQMEGHVEAPLSLQVIAQRSGISERQLQRLFSETLGTTPGNWYLNIRLTRAHYLLKETDHDVLAIGLACGFSSPSTFSRAFRRHFGYSPREVRKRS